MTYETASQNDSDAKEIAILDLFDGWEHSKPTSEKISVYLTALEGIPVDAVKRAVLRLCSGDVNRNNEFMPSAAVLAEQARKFMVVQVEERPLYNGIISYDGERGRVDMRGLTAAEQDVVMSMRGIAPDGRSFGTMTLAEMKQAVAQGMIAGPAKAFTAQLRRMA